MAANPITMVEKMDFLDGCPTCGDEGFIPCPDCDGFEYSCATCGGAGELPCPDCDGEGGEEQNWVQNYWDEPQQPEPAHEIKSDTLVIHPADRSTDFLTVIYEGKGFDVLNRYRGDVNQLLPQYQRIIMLGHGWVEGLFSIGKFPGSFAIGDASVPLLQGKNNVYIWCNAQSFVRHHGLNGFSTGMFVSEVGEATMFRITTTQEAVTYSNNLFAKVMGKHIQNPVLETILKEYDGDDPVIQFNRQQMQGIGLLSRMHR